MSLPQDPPLLLASFAPSGELIVAGTDDTSTEVTGNCAAQYGRWGRGEVAMADGGGVRLPWQVGEG